MRKAEKEIYEVLLEDGKLEELIFKMRHYKDMRFQRKCQRYINEKCRLTSDNFCIEHIDDDRKTIKSYIYASTPTKRINLYINNVRPVLAKRAAKFIVASNQMERYLENRRKNYKICINDIYLNRVLENKKAKEEIS